MQSRRDLLTNF